jgi:allophanate hydrolase
MAETVADLVKAHRAHETTPEESVARTFDRIRTHGDPAVFISLRDEAEVCAETRALRGQRKAGPLYGVPVAIKAGYQNFIGSRPIPQITAARTI